MKFDTILLEKKGSIQTLIFNRPEELNKIIYPLIEEVNSALKQLRNDEEARVLIITLEQGKAFMAGADLKLVQDSNYLQMRRFLGAILDILTQIEDLEIPVIAAINGPAIGGGFELNLFMRFQNRFRFCCVWLSGDQAWISPAPQLRSSGDQAWIYPRRLSYVQVA